METLDLVKILAGCPKGTPLYSTIHGNVKLDSVDADVKEEYAIKVDAIHNGQHTTAFFVKDGRYFKYYHDGECVLFPSKDCRDWSQFKHPQHEFKKGDHILWHNNDGNEFFGVFFRYTEDGQGVIRLLRGEIVSDWDIYIKDLTKVEKFDPKLFKTGDAVLVRDRNNTSEWCYSHFSHISFEDGTPYFIASCCSWAMCIPYNAETKHLIGTTEDAPEFYNFK